MSAANKQKYADMYTVEKYGQRMAAVFDELLARRKRAGPFALPLSAAR
jgi:hypothetical protein